MIVEAARPKSLEHRALFLEYLDIGRTLLPSLVPDSDLPVPALQDDHPRTRSGDTKNLASVRKLLPSGDARHNELGITPCHDHEIATVLNSMG